MRPAELVLPSGALSEATQRVLKAALRGPRTNRLAAPASAADVSAELDERDYFSRAAGIEPGSRDAWPALLKVRRWDKGTPWDRLGNGILRCAGLCRCSHLSCPDCLFDCVRIIQSWRARAVLLCCEPWNLDTVSYWMLALLADKAAFVLSSLLHNPLDPQGTSLTCPA
jgi:hypothetical protein